MKVEGVVMEYVFMCVWLIMQFYAREVVVVVVMHEVMVCVVDMVMH